MSEPVRLCACVWDCTHEWCGCWYCGNGQAAARDPQVIVAWRDMYRNPEAIWGPNWRQLFEGQWPVEQEPE